MRGEPGHEIVPELYPAMGEPIIDKPGASAFTYTDFELLLRNKGVKNLVFTGVTTDVGVSTTMREASDRGYDCVLLDDGTASIEPSLHMATCDAMRMEGGVFGSVTKVEDLINGVENFKSVTVKKLAPQMSNVAT